MLTLVVVNIVYHMLTKLEIAARMLVAAPEYTKGKYNLKELKALETVVSEAVNINVPYNNPVT